MLNRLLFSSLLWMMASTSSAQKPNEPVGPVKPVEIVNESLDVSIENPELVVTPSAIRQPFQWKVFSVFNDTSSISSEECVSVPNDQWLIVEHVSSRGNSANEVMFLNIESNAVPGPPGGTGFTHSYAMESVFTFPSSARRFQIAANTRIYSAPGTSLCIFFLRGITVGGVVGESMGLTVDGILTDQP